MRFEHRHGHACRGDASAFRPDFDGDTAMKTLILKSLAIAALSAAGAQAFAGEEMLDVDTRFRAKIAKEKIKMEALERRAQSASANGNGNGNGTPAPACGSQSIGNLDTDGRIGATPREVFVFAPNAINLVTASGCK
jgi:hypothetical protein